MEMKNKALALADQLYEKRDVFTGSLLEDSSAMIRRLVEELDKVPEVVFDEGVYRWWLPNGDEFVIVPKSQKPLSDEEIDKLIQEYKIGEFSGFYIDKAMTESMYARYNKVFAFVKAIEERHGIK